MTVHTGLLRVATEGNNELVDLTDGVRSVVRTSEVQVGLAVVFARGSTVAITTMEYEPGGVRDLDQLLERLVPARREDGLAYAHNQVNQDTNAHSHLRAALIGPSESIPIIGGELALGTWQQIVLVDLDVRPRERAVTVQVVS